MARTDWSQVVYDKQLATAKSVHKKLFVTQKILASELPEYIDAGWEKCKDYKSPKYVGIAKEKPVDEQFEDRIWLMFAGMGFYGLNAENGILISYDFSNDDLKERIGVLAVDDETALVGLCHASEAIIEKSFAAEITAFSDKISGIRKEVLKQFPGRKLKFIWASHNFIMNRRDLALLDKAGMAYFSDTTVEYYTDLAKHLGSCSRYQLLGSLFANQEIKNMDDKVPAIQGKMGGYTYYSFSIEPEKLLKIGYVLHRSEANKNMMPTYQRLIKKKRLQEVRSFINDGGYFPNSIIISIDTNGKGLVFDQSASKVDSTISKIGILHMPFTYIGLRQTFPSTDNITDAGVKGVKDAIGSISLSDILSNDFYKSLKNCIHSQRKLEMLNKTISVLESDPVFARSDLKHLIDVGKSIPESDLQERTRAVFKRLSSGHQVIMLTLVQLIAYLTERTFVILDEPENHLHPPLLAAFIRALSELLISYNGVALIATHSPVILQEVPRKCAWKLNRNGNEVTVSRLEIESFGATIGALTREVFGLEVRQSGFHKMLCDEVNKGLGYGEIKDLFHNELGDEALALLRTLLALRDEDKK